MAVRGKRRVDVLQRDNYRCRFCGATSAEARLHVDHILPRSEGGTDALDNLATLCEDCNIGKRETYLGDYTRLENMGPPTNRTVPLFRPLTIGAIRTWSAFTPEWRLERIADPDPVVVEWRFRSRYFLTPWEARYTREFSSRMITAVLDFSLGPTREDARLKENELGLEIRCTWGIGGAWRHELHVFPITRTEPSPGKILVSYDSPRIPADVWIVRAGGDDEG